MPVVKRAVASPIMRPQPPPSTQRRRAVPRAADNENVDIVSPTTTGTTATRSLKPQSSAQVLTEHVLNNSPGRTPKARGPPKAPPVERNDGFRYMTEAEMAASYYFERQIGCGNWASVWIVQPRDASRGQVKAMKIVHRASQSGALQRFNALLNEYKVLSGMPCHPNVVCFEDLVLSPSYACLVMPFYDQPMTVCLPFAACRVYFAKMAEAVEWLHEHWITHNDIKLANTLVNRGAGEPYGQPVLVDFGFARNHSPCYGTNFISRESWGTPEYLSPERSVGEAHDERLSDIWALGISFFEMATGRTPFEKKNEVFTTPEAREEYYRRTVESRWYTDYDLPFEIEDLCRAIVQVDPQQRLNVREILQHDFFQDAIEAHLDSSPPSSVDSDDSLVNEDDVDPVHLGRRLTYGESDSAATQEVHASDDAVKDVRSESTVPFPTSPSPATPATPASPSLVDASFETSDLMHDAAPWTKRISSDVTRSLLEAVESPQRARIPPATEVRRKPAAAAAPQTRQVPLTTPRRYVVTKNAAATATQTPTHPRRKPVDSARSTRGGLITRPGAPTPSRFRSSVTTVASAVNSVAASPGVSPIRYVGTRPQDASQRSLLPLPTRLASGSVSANVSSTSLVNTSTASASASGIARAATIAAPARRPGRNTAIVEPRRVSTADSSTAPPRYNSIVTAATSHEDNEHLEVEHRGEHLDGPEGAVAVGPDNASAAHAAAEQATPSIATVTTTVKSTVEVAIVTDVNALNTLDTIGEESGQTLLDSGDQEASNNAKQENRTIAAACAAPLPVQDDVVAKLKTMKQLADELSDLSTQAQNQLQVAREATTTTSQSTLTAATQTIATPGVRPLAVAPSEASTPLASSPPARHLDSVGTTSTSVMLISCTANNETASTTANTSLEVDSPRASSILMPALSTAAATNAGRKRKDQGSMSILSFDLSRPSMSGSNAGTPSSARTHANTAAKSKTGSGGDYSSVSKLLRRATKQRGAAAEASKHSRGRSACEGGASSPTPTFSTSVTPTPMPSPTTTIGSSSSVKHTLLHHRRSRSVQPAQLNTNISSSTDGHRLIGEAPSPSTTSTSTRRRRGGPVTPSSGFTTAGPTAAHAVPLWKKLRGAVRDVAERTL